MPFDAIVVGGSYAGLSAAMQLARARRRVLIVDAGKPRNRFADAGHGFFGQDGRPPFAILDDARRLVLAYPTVEFVVDEVTAAADDAGGFVVTLASGRTERAARLVLATGVRDELPDVPGVKERWGHTVLHCPYCHGYEVADRPLGVLANHPISTHQGILIPDWGPTTYFTQGMYEPEPDDLAKMMARRTQIERTPIVELLGAAPELEAVRLSDGRVVPVHALFTAPRQSLASPLAERLGCEVEDGPLGPYVRVDGRQHSSVEGIYVAGDAAAMMHNATMASAAGVMAGVGVHQSLIMAAANAGSDARAA
jgi:thioredoxin reductase